MIRKYTDEEMADILRRYPVEHFRRKVAELLSRPSSRQPLLPPVHIVGRHPRRRSVEPVEPLVQCEEQLDTAPEPTTPVVDPEIDEDEQFWAE